MIESINTTLCVFGLTWIDKTILSMQIFENQCNLFPPETFFHILLDDNMVTNDVIAELLSFNTLLATLATCMRSHHTCSLACAAIWILGEMRELVLCTGCFGNEFFWLLASGVFMTFVLRHKFIKKFVIFFNFLFEARL